MTPLPIPTHVADLSPYESARSLLKGDDWIFLDANESPFIATDVLNVPPPINRYPDPTADALRDAVASFYGLKRENLMMANGSDELIDLLLRSFVRPGRRMVTLQPSYGFYRVSADTNAIPYTAVALRSDFSADEEALSAALTDADLLILCSPNNPTGTIIDYGVIERLCRNFSGVVIVDEAYGEFADAEGVPSAITLVREGIQNLVVLRTFSKAFGAAGIRLGYGIADAAAIDVLLRMKAPYNVNVLTQTVGLELWNKRASMEQNVRLLLAERERLKEACAELGCRVLTSSANFFLFETPPGVQPERIYNELIARNRLVIRRFHGKPELKKYLRISIGSREQNDLFLSSFRSLL